MSVVENTKLAPELNFGTRDSSYPVYHYRNLYPANGAERNFNIPVGGSNPVTFDIPTEQVNIGDSYLEYLMTLQLPGANMFNWLFRDVFGEIQSCVYRDTGTQYLINERDLNYHAAVINRLDTSHIDLEYQDPMNGISVSNAPLSDVKSKRFDNTTNSLAYKEKFRGWRE